MNRDERETPDAESPRAATPGADSKRSAPHPDPAEVLARDARHRAEAMIRAIAVARYRTPSPSNAALDRARELAGPVGDRASRVLAALAQVATARPPSAASPYRTHGHSIIADE